MKLNLPNKLTVLRICLVPVLLIVGMLPESVIRTVMIAVLLIVVFRELAVTSMRLVVSTGNGIVIAANYLGKIKTVSQIVCVCTVFLEPVVEYLIELIIPADRYILHGIYPLTWLTMAFTVVMTVWSGVNYIKSYWKYLDPEK